MYSFCSEVPLLIYVEDVNDNSPFFEYLFYNSSVPEDTEGGTPVLQVDSAFLIFLAFVTI